MRTVGYYAHRDENKKTCYRLSPHLALVAVRAAAGVVGLRQGEEMAPVAATLGLAHDFGKYTSFFQEYLLTGKISEPKEHAFISGIWAAYLCARQGTQPEYQLLAFLAVLSHHRDLDAPGKHLLPARVLAESWDNLNSGDRRRLEIAREQMTDLVGHRDGILRSLRCAARWADKLLLRQGQAVPGYGRWPWEEILEDFASRWLEVYGGLYRYWHRCQRQPELSRYMSLLALFSSLIDADKLHAGRVAVQERRDLPAGMVTAYKSENFCNRGYGLVNALRETVYQNAAARCDGAPEDQHLFTLTAPTGSGKTLAVLNAALALRERLAAKYGTPPRIIYALPFTSIIDQNHDIFSRVLFRAIPGFEVAPSGYLLKHHHLADLAYRDEEEDDRGFDSALLLAESWQSEIVVTTFVQLLHTLIGYRNRMLKKFNRLARAIVIMDEVQGIPVKYWPLVTEVLRWAAAELGLRFILMTATRPEWFAAGEALELAGEPEEVAGMFQILNRVRLEADVAACTVPGVADEFLVAFDPAKSYLVVLNTIRSSIDFYRHLEKTLGGRVPLFYLSTNIVPAERERRLTEIKAFLNHGVKLVLVSTQVVEAGVDLDFDVAWRDIGPIDAVVQVAGRVNRNSSHRQGSVRVFRLVDERERMPAVYVYGKVHLLAAQELFRVWPAMEEPDFHQVVADFFQFVQQRKEQGEAVAILKAMQELRFSRNREEETLAVRDFQLIQDLPNQVQVFMAVTPQAEEVWQRYQVEVCGAPDLRRRHRAFYRLRREFYRYILSVPAKLVQGKVSTEARPLYLPAYLAPEFYDEDTGFRRVEEGMFIM